MKKDQWTFDSEAENNRKLVCIRLNENVPALLSARGPFAVADPNVEPHSGDGVDGIAEDRAAVLFEVLPLLGSLIYFFGEVLFVVLLRYHAVSHQIGILRQRTHIVPRVLVACTPWMIVLSAHHVFFHLLHQRRNLVLEGVAVRVVEETLVGGIYLIGLLHLFVPFRLDEAVDVVARREGPAVAMERHVAVGNVMAENEEPHGNVVVGGRDGIAAFFHAQHLETVDDGMGQRLAAVGQVAVLYGERLFIEGRLLSQLVHLEGAGQFLESVIGGLGVGTVLDNVTGAHVLEHLVGIPRALDDKVAIIVEPFDQRIGIGLQIFRYVGVLESFDSHKSYPGMCILFHGLRY